MQSPVVVILSLLVFAVTVSAADSPSVRWEFSGKDQLLPSSHGDVQQDQPGPRPPEFPNMAEDNTAVRVSAAGFLSIDDEGPESRFDFSNGDPITIEAWVNPTSARNGQPQYVVGKGRTGSPGFARDNQNWALRLVGSNGEMQLSFLFATKFSNSGDHWHRWDSKNSFPVATGWHHVAVSYRFGDPKSLKGWINGQPTLGTWSYAGETTEPPVVDDDEIRIGNSFEGMLDGVAIHRTTLDDKTVASRFHRVGKPRVAILQKEVMPEIAAVPAGQVVVQICPGLATHDRWLNEGETWPAEATRWEGEQFLLPRLPLQFDEWGIRTAWPSPVLLRMIGDVELPGGTHRILLRTRAMSRLWIDGKVVVRTEPITKRPPDGEEPVIPVAEPPAPGVRLPDYNQQEVFGEVTIAATADGRRRKSRFVLELVVGGKDQRTETGEVCIAVQTADGNSFDLLGPGTSRIPLTDAAVSPLLEEIESSLATFDDFRRRASAASQDEFWSHRHQVARDWAQKRQQHDGTRSQTGSPIDALINEKIKRMSAQAQNVDEKQREHFYETVLPVLQENCFRCHGEKNKGGLKLDSRAAALKAGDSETPAIVPGDLETSELITRIRLGDMPPTEEGLSKKEITILEDWVKSGAVWPASAIKESTIALASLINDEDFLRRIYLDTVGVPPSASEARSFLESESPDKRERLVQSLLVDDRFADHWMSFWLDLLAENPSLLNASLNSTGPFRWFLYDSLRDNKPLDRMVTELLMLRGGAAEGGSAGFGLAGENDSPMAAKGHIIASAFLGIELQCARCHDSPYHSTTQEDLYSLAAMLSRKPVTVPGTSRVPDAFFEKQKTREALIQVTLDPGQPVQPQWPFEEIIDRDDDWNVDQLMRDPADTREQLAAMITAPQNQRFARVIVNRIWKQLIGAGIVEPIHDWEGQTASHPELLDWLATELVTHDYDFRHVVRMIVSSSVYQRKAVGMNLAAASELRFFNAPQRRRLSAEQIVDSMHVATGHSINTEELTFVHDGRRPLGSRQTLGCPERAWMFGDLKNERDRPSLSLPKARAVVDVLEVFGWTGARQMPISERETEPGVLQPGVLANGTLSVILTRASYQSEIAELAIRAASPEALTEELFLRVLSRYPKPSERDIFVSALSEGFADRLTPQSSVHPVEALAKLPQVTWFNHLRPKANEIQLERERRVQAGPPADPRLQTEWREVYEDVLWSLMNHREFVWIP